MVPGVATATGEHQPAAPLPQGMPSHASATSMAATDQRKSAVASAHSSPVGALERADPVGERAGGSGAHGIVRSNPPVDERPRGLPSIMVAPPGLAAQHPALSLPVGAASPHAEGALSPAAVRRHTAHALAVCRKGLVPARRARYQALVAEDSANVEAAKGGRAHAPDLATNDEDSDLTAG